MINRRFNWFAALIFSLGSFDEAIQVEGRWVPGRRLNGDETGHNTCFPSMGTFGIYRILVLWHD